MNLTANEINAKLDELEVQFEENRKKLHRLAEQNRRGILEYDRLLNENLYINERIRELLTELWRLQENNGMNIASDL